MDLLAFDGVDFLQFFELELVDLLLEIHDLSRVRVHSGIIVRYVLRLRLQAKVLPLQFINLLE